ncbi:MAG: hypothetical protein JO031_18655 [Ktedonobacteraceae bacterium]|nr:hypothetical protein [Ktedonobacteraceae bacterium]
MVLKLLFNRDATTGMATSLTALIERVGWWGLRACKLRPYTIGNRSMRTS